MARNLYHLGILMDDEAYQAQSKKMISQLSELIESEPTYMSHWAVLYSEMTSPMAEISIVGPNLESIAGELRSHYLPFSLLMGTTQSSELPLMMEKTNPNGKEATIYVCFNKTCKLPVHSVEEALKQLPQNYRIE